MVCLKHVGIEQAPAPSTLEFRTHFNLGVIHCRIVAGSCTLEGLPGQHGCLCFFLH